MNASIYNSIINRGVKIVGWENGSVCLEITNGSKFWYLDGKPHRTNGPAEEYTNGNKYWYLNGQLHRADGPAIENTNGYKVWYLNGQEYTEKEFNIIQSMEKK